VTRDDIAAYMADGPSRDLVRVVGDLVALGWLVPSRVRGVWHVIPPGETAATDAYPDLSAWLAADPDAVFALAGEATAWHLGYLDRRDPDRVPVWVPEGRDPPRGLRGVISVVRLGWGPGVAPLVAPTGAFLRERRLDVVDWAAGLRGFGPEALLVQLAVRPSSFRPWIDLAAHLVELCGDCEPQRVTRLLTGHSSSAWQRAAHILATGGERDRAIELFQARPDRPMVHAFLGGQRSGGIHSEFGVTDSILAPHATGAGKA
jgi:AbiEi antitoxin C-terminal domain